MDIDRLISQAAQLVEAGRRDEALRLLRGLITHEPSSVRAWKWLAYYTSDPNEARLAIEQVLRATPGDEWAQEARRRLNRRKPPQQQLGTTGWIVLGVGIVVAVTLFAIGITQRIPAAAAPDTSGQIVVESAPAAVAPAAPPVAASTTEVNVTTGQEYYTITGDSVESIRRALAENGPRASNAGERVIATAAYEIAVNWSVVESRDGCIPQVTVVDLNIHYTYPYLEIPSTAPPEIPPTWSAFMRRVVAHEEHHGAIAQQCAHEVADAIGRLPSYANCAALGTAVNQVLDAQLESCEARQLQFDAEVGGESFP